MVMEVKESTYLLEKEAALTATLCTTLGQRHFLAYPSQHTFNYHQIR